MKRNYSDLIKNVSERTLTAKGYKFLSRCINIAADIKGTSRYDPVMKETKEKLKTVLLDLIIDKRLNLDQIKELIKSRKFLEN